MQTKTYTPESRAEVVKLDWGWGCRCKTQRSVLQCPKAKATPANWGSTAKRGSAGTVMSGSRTIPESETEVGTPRKELLEMSMERDVVKRRPRTFSGVAAQYAFMKSVQMDSNGIAVPCFWRVTQWIYAGSIVHLRGVQEDERLKVAIKAVHVQTRATCGPLRVQPEPAAQGFEAGVIGLCACEISVSATSAPSRRSRRFTRE